MARAQRAPKELPHHKIGKQTSRSSSRDGSGIPAGAPRATKGYSGQRDRIFVRKTAFSAP